ncbi:MAG: urease accessory protein UreH [Candidatus Woesearchaeota archaeon]|nr:urease accessory protein UreH [Candidatus Woesearchaeota archaeon]
MEFFLFLGIGFLIGIKHAFDADHIVAVNTLLASSKSIFNSLKLGIIWGVGHTITLFFVGFLVLILNITLPQTLALFLEFCVGIMLIILGLGSFHKKLELGLKSIDTNKKSLGIGMIHGLAGSAALILLILTSIQNNLEGLIYILIFGFGSMIGMFCVSLVLYFLFNKISSNNWTPKIAGILSILVGIILIYEVGIIEGLFIL